MRILDSNIWLAALLIHDSQHKKGIEKIVEKDGKILLPEYILLEVTSVLEMRRGKDAADKFLEYTQDNENVEILFSSREFCIAVIELFRMSQYKKLSFVDMALLHLSKKYEVETFDKRLQKAIHGNGK